MALHLRLLLVLCTLFCKQELTAAQNDEDSLSKLSVAELERRATEIDQKLKQLAQFSPRIGVGGIGYRTKFHLDPSHPMWMQIHLAEETLVDQVVLVPVLRRDSAQGFIADAFPPEFRIVMGTDDNPEGRIVAVFSGNEGILPRFAPLIIPITAQTMRWMRIEVDHPPRRWRTQDYGFQLSEILLFHGQRNVALQQRVSVSEKQNDLNAWRTAFLTDGSMPYLMNVPRKAGTVAATSALHTDASPPFQIIIDLEKSLPVSALRLHAVEQDNTAPQSSFGDFGIPNRFRAEGSDSEDFATSRELLTVEFKSIFDMNPVMEWTFPPVRCRYLRLTIEEPFEGQDLEVVVSRVGFAEIEFFANGSNVSMGKQATGNYLMSHPQQTFSRYTDGLNLYGVILSPRDWIEELAERHQLEYQRPLVNAALKKRYTRQKGHLRFAIGLAIVLGSGICVLTVFGRLLRNRQESRIRERIAANLHDELGANLHAIGLLGDMAQKLAKSPEGLNETLERIRGLTERTGTAAKHCANMMAAKEIGVDVEEEMRRDSARLLADLEYQFTLEGAESAKLLKRRTRLDLILFYRECLINIIRHSGATQVYSKLIVDRDGIRLTVDDNGKGYDGEPPKALKRRARLMRAKMSVAESSLGGLQIALFRKKAL